MTPKERMTMNKTLNKTLARCLLAAGLLCARAFKIQEE